MFALGERLRPLVACCGLVGYSGIATIVHGEGSSVVTCWFDRGRDFRGFGRWFGGYENAALANEPMGGDAVLQLPNGSEGKIIVAHAFLGTGTGEFVGSGEPPVAD